MNDTPSTSVDESRWRAAWRLPLILIWTGLLLLPSIATKVLTGRASRRVIALWYRGCCRLLGLLVQCEGRPDRTAPVLYVANHVSYLDILVIGGLLRAHFIAKSEVRSWPGIGYLASLAGTIFVERRARKSQQQRDVISASLAKGDCLILFPEGTSGDGRVVLPFKSSLFSVFEQGTLDEGTAIQPMTIDYARFSDGRPIDGANRDLYAWYGDMTLAPHLSRAVKLPGAQVRVVWHNVIRPGSSVDRKELARQCEEVVAGGLQRSPDLVDQRDQGAAAIPADAA